MLGRETLMKDPGHTIEQAETQDFTRGLQDRYPHDRTVSGGGGGPQRRHLENELHQLMEKPCCQRQSNVSTERILRQKTQYDHEK